MNHYDKRWRAEIVGRIIANSTNIIFGAIGSVLGLLIAKSLGFWN